MMRQEDVIRAGEGKLQDFHARQVERVAQFDHIGRDYTQVFGDDG